MLNDFDSRFPGAGRVEWIGIASERRAEMDVVDRVGVQPGTGIDGEHHAASGNSKRQVTFLQHEHLAVVAQLMGVDKVHPALLRRNVVVSGINLVALKEKRFRIGNVVFEGTGPCAPCSRMEETLGEGGYNAMRGHGGITTRVLEAGEFGVNDAVFVVED